MTDWLLVHSSTKAGGIETPSQNSGGGQGANHEAFHQTDGWLDFETAPFNILYSSGEHAPCCDLCECPSLATRCILQPTQNSASATAHAQYSTFHKDRQQVRALSLTCSRQICPCPPLVATCTYPPSCAGDCHTSSTLIGFATTLLPVGPRPGLPRQRSAAYSPRRCSATLPAPAQKRLGSSLPGWPQRPRRRR